MEEFLDGLLPEKETSLVQEHLRECPRCLEELRAASSVLDALRTLPELRCPEHTLRLIEEATVRRQRTTSLLERLRDFPLWQSASVAVAGAAVVCVLLLTFFDRDQPVVPAYTKHEALEARAVARESLVQVVGIINRTERKAVSGFLGDRLPGTLRKTIRSAAPFRKGGKA